MKTIRLMFFLLLSAVAVWGAPVGSIKGYVRDASGAVIPSAGVTLTNEKTGVEQKTVSDSTGFYQFLDLNPGDYRVTVARPYPKHYLAFALPIPAPASNCWWPVWLALFALIH